jgi:O-antigen ligase
MDYSFLIFLVGLVLFFVTVAKPIIVLPIFIIGSYIEPMQFFPNLIVYNPTSIIGSVVLLGCFLHRMSNPDPFKMHIPQIKVMWIFMIWIILSTLTHTTVSMPVFINVARVLIPYFLFSSILKTRKQVSLIVWLFIILGAVAAVYGIYQFKFNIGIYDRGIKRIVSFFDNPNAFGVSLTILIPLVLGKLMNKKNKPLVKLILLALLAFIMAGVVISYSRSGFIGFIAGIFLFVVLYFRAEKKIVAGVVAIFLLLIMIDIFPSHAKYTMWARMRTVTRAKSANELDSGRAQTNKAGIKMMLKNPVFGVGLGGFTHNYRRLAAGSSDIRIVSEHALVAHNLYVQIGSQLGVCGLLIFFWFILSVMKDLIWTRQQLAENPEDEMRILAVSLQVAVIVFLLCGFLSGILFNKGMWMLLPLSAAIKRIIAREKNPNFKEGNKIEKIKYVQPS